MILVLGATGTVGHETVKALKAKGVAMRAGSRDPKKAEALLGIDAFAWDWEAPQSWAAALAGVDSLFLLTPAGTTKDADYGIAAVEAAKQAGVKKIVRLSVIGADQDPASAHARVEKAVEASGLKWVHVRPTFFAQNCDEGMLPGIKAGSIALPTGEGRTPFVDARDIGAVCAAALCKPDWDGQALSLTGPRALTYGEVAAILRESTGLKVAFKDISTDEFKAAWKSHGVPEHYVEFMAKLYGAVKAGYVAPLADGVRKALGRAPIDFEQYAKDYAKAFQG